MTNSLTGLRLRSSLTFFGIIYYLLISNEVLAQNNVSYNVNSIPVHGSYNSAFGWEALRNNVVGQFNTATGFQALYENSSGNNNSAAGFRSLSNNFDGHDNSAHGYQALYSNWSGNYNVATGAYALYSNFSGLYNVGFGSAALNNNDTGSYNTAVGSAALNMNNHGSMNTALGFDAGLYNQGSSNVFIGFNAGGSDETGSNKLYIGNDAARTLIYGNFLTGQVLLGKPNATGYVFTGTRTLNVLGGVLADSVRTALSGDWADKVFENDYSLRSLEELEQFIGTKKHLPGIPTTKEVASNGINLADMSAKLLEKVEELTLYVIELKKENQRQQEELNKLKSRRR